MAFEMIPSNQNFPLKTAPAIGVRLGPLVDHPPAPPAGTTAVPVLNGEAMAFRAVVPPTGIDRDGGIA